MNAVEIHSLTYTYPGADRPTLKDIHDIFEIRSLLEPLILHQCFHQVDLQWAVDMRTLLLQHHLRLGF